jgi:MFS family permease
MSMDSLALGRSMRLSVAEGGLATAMGSLFSGVFLTGFALTMGASRLQIGILFALPALCGVAQLAGSYWIERFGQCKRLCVAASLASRLLYLPVLLVPLLATGLSAEAKVWWIIGLMAASNILGALAGVAWLTWIKALVPVDRIVPFFGQRNLVNTALSFAVCLAAGALVDYLGNGLSDKLPGFAMVFAAAMACGLVSWAIMARIPAAEAPAKTKTLPFHRTLAAPLRDGNYRLVVFFYTLWNFAVNLAAPFFPVFFIQKLGLPLWYVIALGTLSSLAGMAANNFWTRVAHRFGLKPVVLVATLGDALFPLWLIFIDAQWSWMLLVVHMSGIFNTPIATGPDNFVLKLSPRDSASSYMAVFRAFVGPATALAAILGGWLAGSMTTTDAAGASAALGGLKIVFLLSFAGRVASLLILARVSEERSYSVSRACQLLLRASRRYWQRRQARWFAPAPQPVLLATEASRLQPALPDPAASTAC